MPNCSITFSTTLMYFKHSINRFAYSTTAPIERCCTRVSCLTFPLTICTHTMTKIKLPISIAILLIWCYYVMSNVYMQDLVFLFLVLPKGVPQQRLLSSICSTSRPMNQDPKETSSFAYLCSSCLQKKKKDMVRLGGSTLLGFENHCNLWAESAYRFTEI